MIVADANLLAYLVISGEHSAAALRVFATDSVWVGPGLWSSEIRSVLLKHIRSGMIDLPDCARAWQRAVTVMQDAPREPDTGLILELAISRRMSAYDAEYVAMAVDLGVPLVTGDRRLLAACPGETVSIDDFCRSG